ncbi:hypothetical protein [Palleronia caenipelagi]|uniref:Uncharacterized protein n=1 Tax=Palleronia caenipelagi TaxID=2489174 RepID=A0A547PTD0_9RHOB|nr:hypothetical protein [Palleronia caenipelagi]TRD17304.1 hypothetical protein FEV53_13300 [Palleronia caenipelagi]
MKIELKAIKHSEFASQETNCYQANLYVDGKKIGIVSNDGHGGCDAFHGDDEAFARANAWCRANLPKWKMGFGPNPEEERETDLEMHCASLLNDHLMKKDYTRLVSTKVLFTKTKGHVLYEIKHHGQVDLTAAQIREQHPDGTILNLLPPEEALAIFRAGMTG